jgi:hypothetical protein
MSYAINPMTEEEIEAINLIPDGTYQFEVIRADPKISGKGNRMACLQLQVYDREGKPHIVYDYLIFSSVPLNIKKVKRFCDAVGLHEEYKKGEIPEDLERKHGYAEIGTQEEQPKQGGGFYAKKNIVVEYVMTTKGALMDEANDKFNDTISF